MAKPRSIRRRPPVPESADEFISFSARLLEFGRQHLTAIVVGLVVILVAAAGYGFLQKRQAMRQERAAELFQAATGPQRTDAATLQRELKTIIQDYPETGGALQARLLLANLLFQEGKYQEAAAAYQALMALAPELTTLIVENLSSCYEAQKDYLKAAATLEPLVAKAAAPYRQELRRRQALLWEKAGEPAKALALYQQMLQDNPPAGLLSYLHEKTRRLEAAKP